jgi:hypothetical protein
MSFIELSEAWHWVKIGFCAALGAALVGGGLGVIFASAGGSAATVVHAPEPDPPHCSRCCPTLELDD